MDDRAAIAQLKARYFRYLDLKQWDLFEGLFTADVHFDLSGAGSVVCRGLPELMAFMRGKVADMHTVHQGTMPDIVLTSPTTATGAWAMEDWVGGEGVAFHGQGYYFDEYRKEAGAWKIATLRLCRLHQTINGISEWSPNAAEASRRFEAIRAPIA